MTLLAAIGDPAIAELSKAAGRYDRSLQERALTLLGLLMAKSALPVVLEAAKDREFTVRLAAVHALGNLGDESARAPPDELRQFAAGYGVRVPVHDPWYVPV